MHLQIQAAYGSGKDVNVYKQAGVLPSGIFKVSALAHLPGTSMRASRKNRFSNGYISLEEGYAQHLNDLHSGNVEIASKPAKNPEFSSLITAQFLLTKNNLTSNPPLETIFNYQTNVNTKHNSRYLNLNIKL